MDNKKLITYYNNNTYDLTNYINKHPGGNIIINAHNNNLIDVWKKYGVDFHINNDHVTNILNQYIVSNSKILETFYNNNFIHLSFN